MKWRNEGRVKRSLEAVQTAPPEKLDRAIVKALEDGAEFREIADAAGITLNMTYRRAVSYRKAREVA